MKSICVYGPGAVGGLIAALLADAGHPVSVVARGLALESIRARGLKLDIDGRTITARVRASDAPKSLGPHDVLILAVKAPALAAIADSVRHLMGPNTVVMPAMNGVPWWFAGLPEVAARTGWLNSVDPKGRLNEVMPIQNIAGSAVHIASRQLEPGHIKHSSGKGIVLGAPHDAAKAGTDELAALLSNAGLDVTRAAQIERDIWFKLWGNMTLNPISALTRATMDRILDDPLITAFIVRAMEEARQIGQRMGILVEDSIEMRLAVTRKLGAVKTSMLQDMEASRPPEIDALIGSVQELGQIFGVSTPAIDTLYGLTRLHAETLGLYGKHGQAAGIVERPFDSGAGRPIQ